MRKILWAAALAATLAFGGAPSEAQTFSATSASQGGIGTDIDSAYDVLSFAGGTGAAFGTATVGIFTFDGGTGNCVACVLTPTGTLSFDLTIGAVTKTENIGWAWSSNMITDTIALTLPADDIFNLGATDMLVSFSGPASLAVSAGASVVTANLLGTFTERPGAVEVPEPASMALLGVGLTGLGLTRIRRKKPCLGQEIVSAAAA